MSSSVYFGSASIKAAAALYERLFELRLVAGLTGCIDNYDDFPGDLNLHKSNKDNLTVSTSSLLRGRACSW